MGINVGFVYDPEPNSPAAHSENDICLVVSNLDALDALATRGGVKMLSELGLGDDPEDPETEELPMLDPKDGLRTLEALLKVLKANPEENPDAEYPEILVAELEELAGCLREAAGHNAKFRFTVIL